MTGERITWFDRPVGGNTVFIRPEPADDDHPVGHPTDAVDRSKQTS